MCMYSICPIANVIYSLVFKNHGMDQRVCHLSVCSYSKNVHCRYAHSFNIIMLITMPRCSPSVIPQMSDIYIRIHLTALKEEKKNFLDDNQG